MSPSPAQTRERAYLNDSGEGPRQTFAISLGAHRSLGTMGISRKRSVSEERLPLGADWRNDRRMVDHAEQVPTTGLVDTKQRARQSVDSIPKR